MAKVKLILDNRRTLKTESDSLKVEVYPIKIVISHLSKSAYLATNYTATIKHWDEGRIRSGCPSVKGSIKGCLKILISESK